MGNSSSHVKCQHCSQWVSTDNGNYAFVRYPSGQEVFLHYYSCLRLHGMTNKFEVLEFHRNPGGPK